MKEIIPFAVYIKELQQYNFDFFSLEEVVFFEYLIIKAQSFKREFFHSSATIEKETGIKRSKLKAIINKFEKLGIVKVEVKGFPLVKYFIVDFVKIQTLLPKIYQSAETCKLYAGFFKLLAETCTQKNNNKNDNKNIIYSSDWEFFINFLEEIKTREVLSSGQFLFKEEDLQRAISTYKKDIIIYALEHYFKDPSPSKTVHLFLQPDPLNGKKLPVVEMFVKEQNQRVLSFIKNLNEIHTERRTLASNSKKEYALTQLMINKGTISQITALLNCRTEREICNAFIAYCDQVLNGTLEPRKFLPLFLAKNNLGEYSVIDASLDNFNINYCIPKTK